MTKAIVIGAGVLGASIAHHLAKAGVGVVVIEKGTIGAGASIASFACINSNDKFPDSYHHLNVAGIRAHRALREEVGAAPWLHAEGTFEWRAEAARDTQRARFERLRGLGYAAEWVSREDFLAREPAILPAAVGDAPIAYYAEEGWVDPVLYATSLLDLARANGAAVHAGSGEAVLRVSGGRVTGVEAAGTLHEADVVVNAGGANVNSVTQDGGLHLPMASTIGMIVLSPPLPTSLRYMSRTPAGAIRPDGAGRIMLHSVEADREVDLDAGTERTRERAAAALARALSLLDGKIAARPEAVRTTMRPLTRDGLPAVGPLPGLDNYFVAVTHSGITLAPYIGRAVAQEILGAGSDPALADYLPARFFP